MTTHEEQDERVIPLQRPSLAKLRPGIDERRLADQLLAVPPGRFTAQEIRHAACGHVNEPSARIVGDPFLRPLDARGDERLLHRILGGGKILEAPESGAENLRRQLAQQILGVRVQAGSGHASTGGALMTSRTSIGMLSGCPPLPGAADAPAAIS